MAGQDLYIQRQEERQSWREHRRAEAQAFDEAWRAHAERFLGVRSSSDPERVKQTLIAEGKLFPIQARPTLRLDWRAREWRPWSPEEICDL